MGGLLAVLVGMWVWQGRAARSQAPTIGYSNFFTLAEQGKVKSVRDSLFLSYLDTQRAIRDERWKLILFPKIAKRELFDLANDPDEMKNLAEEPAQAERIAALTAKLRDWQQRLGDTAPLTVAKPEPAEFVPPSQ